jgi:hypothetical protein
LRLLNPDQTNLFNPGTLELLKPLDHDELAELARAKIIEKKSEERRKERMKRQEEERKAMEAGKEVPEESPAAKQDFDFENIQVKDDELKAYMMSKKAPEVRRNELLSGLMKPLVELLKTKASELVHSIFGTRLIIETVAQSMSSFAFSSRGVRPNCFFLRFGTCRELDRNRIRYVFQ